jgi:hypothetical protein
MANVPIVSIEIENLLIDLQNPRFDPKSSQRDALQTIIHDQGKKLYNLAEDIVDSGVNPCEPLLVTQSEDPDFHIVLEGNRRVAALKLLSSPQLLESVKTTKGLHNKYRTLHDRAENTLPTELQCVVLPREDAKNWIMLKHTGENDGVGVVPWDGRARHRFRGSSPALQAIDLVEKAELLDQEAKENLPKIAITNVERILGTPDARQLIGVDVKENKSTLKSPEENALGRLALIVSDVAKGNIRVSHLDRKEQRIAYAQEIASRPLPKPVVSAAKVAAKRTTIRVPAERTTLIPKKLQINISQTRINRIYGELQKLNAESFRNSCAVLLRVFVELTVDDFAKRHRLSLKKRPKSRKGVPTQLKDMTLREKLTTVANHLEAKNICDKHELHGIRTLVSNRNHVLSIDTLNAYVHNKDYNPTATDLKTTWDNIQVFIERLWST